MAASETPALRGLERIHPKRRRRDRLRLGLLGPYLDELADAMADDGYARDRITARVRWAHVFGGYAAAHGVTDPSELSDAFADAFVTARRRLTSISSGEARRATGHLRCLLAFLRSRGVVPRVMVPPERAPGWELLAEFEAYLHDHRGISSGTIEQQLVQLGAFLRFMGDRATASRLGEISADDLRRFLVAHCESLTRSQRSFVCITLRGFLRFARIRGYLARDMVAAVPTIPRFRLDRVPPVLPWEDMQRTIRAVDTRTPKGRRDQALLLVLATYGMRIAQVRRLRLDDLDWRQQTIRFRAAKGGRDVVLPLTAAVGEALVAWLKIRPAAPWREVFLRMRAPLQPLKSNLYALIERYARKAGVDAAIVGARTWRHGRATHMLERGQTLKTIRDMLGHRSIESTFIYTKVDLPMLRQAALDWPGDAP